MPLASHIKLPPRYRVNRHIASGGMATVWEVDDLLLARVVAVKVLTAQFALDPAARARFQREARTAARVSSHPHIATIYDIGEEGDGAFIVMEYFAGGTVADRLRAARDGGPAVSRETALRWLAEAAAALDVAHEAGIVHRDVKPANLLLDHDERLAVGDFGIARLADDTHMTQTGQVLGTAAYLSPEQALGHPATAASDRYALAVVAFELLTGRRPFAGGPPSAQARQHVEIEPARASVTAPELPGAVDAVLARGLAKEPAERPASASELVEQLERALREPAGATQPTPPTRPLAAVAPAAAAASTPAPAPPPRRASPPTSPPRARRPPPPAAAPQRRRPPAPLALIVAAAAIAGVVLAVILASGDGTQGERAATTPRATQTANARTGADTAAQPAQEEPAAAVPASASKDPAALNDQGFELIKAERYAEAVAPLQASVQGYRDAGRTGEAGFAYALYNLGVALNRSGNPAAAVPVLEERLKYKDQIQTVRAELADALAKLGRKPARGGGKKDKDSEN